MNKYLYAILRLKTTSWIKYWLYNKSMKIKGVLSNILEGISFYLTDSLNRKFNLFQIIGRSVQDGTPTPENPVEIKNTGDNGSINEKVQNKNLFSSTLELGTLNNSTGLPGSSVIDTCLRTKDYISVQPSTTYTISNNKGYYTFLYFYKADKTFISYSRNTNDVVTFTTDSNTYFIKLRTASDRNENDTTALYQLEQGSTATEYQAHEEQNISFPLAEGQKFYDGDYLADDGIHHVMREIIVNGSESGWAKYGNDIYTTSSIIQDAKKYNNSLIYGMCDKVAQLSSGALNNSYLKHSNRDRGLELDSTSTYWGFTGSTVEEFKEWLAQNPIKIQYELEEEVIDAYTPEQAEAWEQIKALRTYKGGTHISSEDELPANLKIQYWKEE